MGAMDFDKDIKFTEKRVDDSWKEQVSKDKQQAPAPAPAVSAENSSKPNTSKTSKPFMNLLTSLGLQALMSLGEIPHPETQTAELNLEAAKEIIDLLSAIKQKTSGSLSSEEDEYLSHVLPELQIKFSQKI